VARLRGPQPIATRERAKQPLPGLGAFQWNGGGWFGGQVGGTAWLLVGAVVLAAHAPGVAAVWLACFAVANAICYALWVRRDRNRPFPAVPAELLVCGAAGLLALIALQVMRPGLRIANVRGVHWWEPPASIPWFVVLILGLVAQFSLQEWGARKARSRETDRA
jgi:hypothetical protein